MTRMRADTERYGSGEAFNEEGRPLAAIPLNGYLDRIGASPEARIQFWPGGRSPEMAIPRGSRLPNFCQAAPMAAAAPKG